MRNINNTLDGGLNKYTIEVFSMSNYIKLIIVGSNQAKIARLFDSNVLSVTSKSTFPTNDQDLIEPKTRLTVCGSENDVIDIVKMFPNDIFVMSITPQ
jgi:hypothetical protein